MVILVDIPDSPESRDLETRLAAFTPEEKKTILLVGLHAIQVVKARQTDCRDEDGDGDGNGNGDAKRQKKSLEGLFFDLMATRDETVAREVAAEKEQLRKESFSERQLIESLQRDLIQKEEYIKHLVIVHDMTRRSEAKESEVQYAERLSQYVHQRKLDEIGELTEIIEAQNAQMGLLGNKSNRRGVDGENYFMQVASQTFCACTNFEILEKKKEPHCGDFWLKFDKFTVMVDSKNYIDSPVPSRDRVKLKNDIAHNRDIKVAWLVSMDQPIMTFANFPFMIDIEDGVCYCYINSLMKYEKPDHLLRMAWYACNFVYDHILNVENDVTLVGKYEKNEIRIKAILHRLLAQSRNRFAILNQFNENFKQTESDIRDCLNEEIRNVTTQNTEIVEQWFAANVVGCARGQVKTNDLYKLFMDSVENKSRCIDGDLFREIIRSIAAIENDMVRGKTDKSQIIINRHKLKLES
jgi:hypothetical protein